MLKKELEANKEAYFDMRDREKSFKQKIKEERRELKQDREKLTKKLIETQILLKHEVKASNQIKIKKQKELILDFSSKIKDAKNLSNVPLKKVIN